MKTEISIILPTYNEADNIVPLIEKIIHYLNKYHYEVILIDDNSPDGTAQRVSDRFKKQKEIKVYIRKTDLGLAKAIRFGVNKSCGEFIIAMDTDFNHNPKDIFSLLTYRNSFDMVVGSRYIKGGGMENRIRYYLSSVYNQAIRQILKLSTCDNLSGFFLIKRKKLLLLPADKIYFGYGDYFIRLLFFANQLKFTIKEIPVFYKNRFFGQSKSNFISMFIDYSKTVLQLLFNEKN
jgi:dolichol-phosphate mannosyltransferase